ncbi:MAG: hypothetical protein KTV77_04675 [Wolbachia endosymbiont of Fragariocoptes setiger]|nr:hypothetical protein [Wolbachia endosymbiont of Fragariocoptes setiger]
MKTMESQSILKKKDTIASKKVDFNREVKIREFPREGKNIQGKIDKTRLPKDIYKERKDVLDIENIELVDDNKILGR